MRRVVSVWFPHFSTDRLTATDLRHRAPPDEAARPGDRPVVTTASTAGRAVLTAINAPAGGLGLRPGMALADARALAPALVLRPAAPETDRQALQAIAVWCERYTPWVAEDGPPAGGTAGLVLDVTGCSHLQGGEGALLADLLARCRRAGWTIYGGLAGTAAAAWAAARYGCGAAGAGAVVAAGTEATFAATLPVAALRLPAPVTADLGRVGLRRIGELAAMPRPAVVRRFGRGTADRLDQFTGIADVPVSPRRPTPDYRARLCFADPIGSTDAIAAGLARLLDDLVPVLARAGVGIRVAELSLFTATAVRDAAATPLRVSIGTSRASQDRTHLSRLFAERLRGLAARPDIDAMLLTACRVESVTARQIALPAAGHTRPASPDAPARCPATAPGGRAARPGGHGLADLVDRIAARCGHGAVRRPLRQPSHIPERSVRWIPVAVGCNRSTTDAAVPAILPAALPADALAVVPGEAPWGGRPIRMFERPEPVTAIAVLPDHPPVLIRWRDRLLRIRAADGPERLAPEWWHITHAGDAAGRPAALADDAAGASRDYYRIEDFDGARYWVFRTGGTGATARWFVHGVFG